MGNVHTSNALVLYSCASFCKTLADIVVRFVTGRYRLIFRLEEHVSHTTLRVLYEIRVGWSDKASPAERDYRVGLRDTGHAAELRPARSRRGNGKEGSLGTKRTGSRSAKREADMAAPAGESGNEAERRVGWVLEACSRVMRPVVRLALAFGLKHSDLELALRELLIDEARRAWRQSGIEPNISQLSVTTGLNRKAVTTKVREDAEALPHTEMSAVAGVATHPNARWRDYAKCVLSWKPWHNKESRWKSSLRRCRRLTASATSLCSAASLHSVSRKFCIPR